LFILVIPLPLFFSQVIYGVKGLSAWVVIGIIWTFAAAITVVLYPLWESRIEIVQVCKGIVKDIMKPGSGKYEARSVPAA
jgi:urea-proton symporter